MTKNSVVPAEVFISGQEKTTLTAVEAVSSGEKFGVNRSWSLSGGTGNKGYPAFPLVGDANPSTFAGIQVIRRVKPMNSGQPPAVIVEGVTHTNSYSACPQRYGI